MATVKETVELPVPALCCPDEAWQTEEALNRLEAAGLLLGHRRLSHAPGLGAARSVGIAAFLLVVVAAGWIAGRYYKKGSLLRG